MLRLLPAASHAAAAAAGRRRGSVAARGVFGGAPAAPPPRARRALAAAAATAAAAGAATLPAAEPPPPRRRSLHLIFNPAAGQEDPAAILGDVVLELSKHFLVTVWQTEPRTQPEALARQALERGADVVVASGGDGTVGAVAGALVNTGVPLGVVPRGTANAFATALGIPTHMDSPADFHRRAVDAIVGGFARDVDTALVSTSEVTDQPMVLLLGVGFEAEAVDAAGRDLKDAIGPLAYVVSGAQQLLSVENFDARVVVDGEEASGRVAAVTVANAAPPFSVLAHGHTDGKLEAIGYVADEGSVGSPVVNVVNLVRLFNGVMFGDQPVQHEERIFGGRYSDIRVECDPPQKVVLDGELVGTTPVHARVVPRSLRVLVPPPPDSTAELARQLAAEEGLTPAVAELVAEEMAAEGAAAAAGGSSSAVLDSARAENRPVVGPRADDA